MLNKTLNHPEGNICRSLDPGRAFRLRIERNSRSKANNGELPAESA